MSRILSCLLLILSACMSAFSQKKDVPYVILVSFDGFRYDYVAKYNLPNFSALIKSGSRAEALIPCFPSKTFPNHYSIVTGLYPGDHGLVDNSFYDPHRNEKFTMANKNCALDSYYYGGTPLWRLAQQQGLKSASYFWVGSEAPIDDHYPDYYFHYADTVANSNRVAQVLQWLKMPEAERPHFITLYFSLIDDAGHTFGPGSGELTDKLKEADKLLGDLMNGIKKDVNLPINLIVVSDHGMQELTYKPDTYIFLDEIVDVKDTSITIVNNGTHAHIYLKNKTKVDSLVKVLSTNSSDLKVYRSQDFLQRWHYQNSRSGDIFITAEPGKEITLKSREKIKATMKPGSHWGVHGYDPDVVKDMSGIFYAAGPNIKQGIVVPPFRNIHIYPLVATILQLKIPTIDGSADVLKSIYRP